MKKKLFSMVVIPLIGLIAIVCSALPLILASKNPFDNDSLNYFLAVFDFADMGVMNMWPFITICLAAVLFIVSLIVLIVKKFPRYLFPIILGLIASLVSVYCYRCFVSVPMADRQIYYTILLASGVALAILELCLSLFVLIFDHKELPQEEPVEEKIAPKMDGAVEMDYDDDYSKEEKPAKEEPVVKETEEKKEEPQEEIAEEEAIEEEPEPIIQVKQEGSQKQQKAPGKYEVYPEAGFFKFRLKANNGEILLVSNGYRTREGARSGIATLKKNVPTGNAKIVTDKNGFSQFRIFTANDSRLVVAGEFYSSAPAAQKALKSVERFYANDRIVDLDSLPESEIREWRVELPPINANKNGKFEIFVDEDSKKWQGRLIASNGALLFLTSTYSTKNAVLNAYGNIQSKVLEGDLSIYRDKQNRYHFRVISENGSVILMGETYPSRDSAVSAAVSVRNFVGNARIVDLTKPL